MRQGHYVVIEVSVVSPIVKFTMYITLVKQVAPDLRQIYIRKCNDVHCLERLVKLVVSLGRCGL